MESGTYDIDPDGSNVGDGPISVYCNATTGIFVLENNILFNYNILNLFNYNILNQSRFKGSTSISHDSEAKTSTGNGCTGPGCYNKQVEYTASVKQMRALIDISKECRQFMEV